MILKKTENMIHTINREGNGYILNSYNRNTYKVLQPIRTVGKKARKWAFEFLTRRINNLG